MKAAGRQFDLDICGRRFTRIGKFTFGYLQFDLALDREMVYPPALMKWTNANSCSMTPLAGFAATEASYPHGVARTRRIDVDQALAGRHAR